MEKIRIVACGSTFWDRLVKNWGVSFLIGEDILFDTFGKPSVLSQGIERLNIDISKIKHIILSHEDWDHTSGLKMVTERNKEAIIYVCEQFSNGTKDIIKSLGNPVVEISEGVQIKEDIYTTGQLYGETEKRFIYEQALAIKSEKGVSIITGCAHPGIVNIVEYVRKAVDKNIYAILGGFHLKNKDFAFVQEVIKRIDSYGIKKVVPMHCTGGIALKLFKKTYGENFLDARIVNEIDV